MQFAVSFMTWGLASGLWAMTTSALLSPTYDKTTQLATDDVTALFTLLLIQVGYPVVSVATGIAMAWYKFDDDEYGDGHLSFAKDWAYAALDMTSKGGLALYFALRVQRFPTSALTSTTSSLLG